MQMPRKPPRKAHWLASSQTMGADDDRSHRSLRSLSDQSLLRSFKTIHCPPVDDTTPHRASHRRGEGRDRHEMSPNDVTAARQEGQRKGKRRGRSQRHDGALQDCGGSRRGGRVAPARPPARHAGKASPASAGAGVPPSRGVAPRRREARRGPGGRAPPPEDRVPASACRGGFRRDYSLGDAARCPSHAIVHPSKRGAARAAASLKKHDFAFVKRSDGSYTYAIVAYRHAPRAPEEEEFMVFVIGKAGSFKTVKRRDWGSLVRLVSAEGMESKPHVALQERPVLCQNIIDPTVVCQEIEGDGEFKPPQVIVLLSPMYQDDDCSEISNVSDRAM